MSKFEDLFEDLDVHTQVMDSAMSTATTLSTPEGQVDSLMKQVGMANVGHGPLCECILWCRLLYMALVWVIGQGHYASVFGLRWTCWLYTWVWALMWGYCRCVNGISTMTQHYYHVMYSLMTNT